MKVTRIEAYPVTIPLKKEWIKPWRYGFQTHVNEIIIKIFTDDGLTGLGEVEADPFESGETLETGLSVIRTHVGPSIIGEDPMKIRRIHERMDASIGGHEGVKGGLDIALYDLIGQHLGVPVYDLIGGCSKHEYTFSLGYVYAKEPEVMAKEAKKWAREGERIIGFKLGLPGESAEEEVRRIRLIREAVGDEVTLLADPNAGWDRRKAVKILHSIQDLNLSFLHQPLPAPDVEGLAMLSRMFPNIQIIGDESVHMGYFQQLIRTRAVDSIALKALRVGGIYPALKMIAAAEIMGIDTEINQAIETTIAETALAHLSLAIGKDMLFYTPLKLQFDVVKKGGIEVNGRTARVGKEPGLGILEIDETLLRPELGIKVS